MSGPSRKSWTRRVPVGFSAAVLLSLVLAGCWGGIAQDPAPAPMPSLVRQPHRAKTTILYCPQLVQYDPALLQASNTLMANWLEAVAARSNQEGLVFYLDPLTGKAFATSALGMTFEVPPIGDYPSPPTLDPTPTLGHNVYDTSAQETVTASNTQRVDQYTQSVQALNQQVSQAQVTVMQHAEQLRTLKLSADPGPASVFGCLEKAQLLFGYVAGQKWLFISSPLAVETGPDDTGTLDLRGINVRMLFLACADATSCKAKEGYWAGVFGRAHAASWLFYAPQESQTLAPLFDPLAIPVAPVPEGGR